MTKTTLILLLTAAAMTAAACGPKGRIKEENEGDLVGAATAGAATYNRLISEATKKLLDRVKPAVGTDRKITVAMTGVDNRSSEELGDIREAIYTITNQVMQDSGLFRTLSRDAVENVMRKHGLRPQDLVMQEGREKFLRELRPQGMEPEYLLTCKVTSLSTTGDGLRQRDYLLTLGMVNVSTLEEFSESAKVRKEYD